MTTQKKTEKMKANKKTSAGSTEAREARDWRPLFGRLRDTIDWGLDIAVALAGDDDEEIEAIERVREYLHGRLIGETIDVDINDVLTTLAILFAAIELDTGIDNSPVLHAMRGAPIAMHLPGAGLRNTDRDHTVVVRRPRRRNASDGFSFLAA
jgi:hypothetical protein